MGEEAHQLSPKVCDLTCLHHKNTVSEHVNAIHAAPKTICHYLVDEEKQSSPECCVWF